MTIINAGVPKKKVLKTSFLVESTFQEVYLLISSAATLSFWVYSQDEILLETQGEQLSIQIILKSQLMKIFGRYWFKTSTENIRAMCKSAQSYFDFPVILLICWLLLSEKLPSVTNHDHFTRNK